MVILKYFWRLYRDINGLFIILNYFQFQILRMIAKMLTGMMRFSAVKYQILNGQYLIPPPPKRALSSYLLYSLEARKNIPKTEGQKTNIGNDAKLIGAGWKDLPAEKKEAFEKKAKELRQEYEKQRAVYEAKYVTPFKRVTATQLLQRQFYQKNKFANLVEGAKAFTQFKASLKQEDLAKFQTAADQLNSQNQKIRKLYQIPISLFKDFNAFLRAARKSHPDLPEKSKISENTLAQLEHNYSEYEKKVQQQLKNFATSFHLKLEDLVKMLNKQKSQDQKLDEQGRNLKTLQSQQKKEALQVLRQKKKKLAQEKAKIKKKAMKLTQKGVKEIQKEVEKQKKVVAKIGTKYSSKLKEVQRSKKQNEIAKKAEKQLKKSKDVTPEVSLTGEPAKKPKGKPKFTNFLSPQKLQPTAATTSAPTSTATQTTTSASEPAAGVKV